MISRFEQFVSAINGIHRCVQRIERDEMEKYGLKGYHAQYLLVLARHPEGITAGELCDVCDINKAAVSRSINELENQDLVLRKTHGGSAYRARLLLTEKGMQAAEWVSARAQAAVDLAGSGMTEEQRKTMYSALGTIASNLRAICREGMESGSEE